MNVLVDTHLLLWALIDDPKLSTDAAKIISDDENEIYYSIASVWEIAIKHIKRPTEMLLSDEEFAKLCKDSGFKPLPIEEKHISLLKTLKRENNNIPEHHDPFDRLMLVQAKAEGYTFLTHDEKIKHYNEPCVITV